MTLIVVEVIRAWPRRHEVVTLQLADGATVRDALLAAGLTCDAGGATAIFGRTAADGDALRHGDRLEVLRPLTIDPKDARRRRASRSK